MHTLTASDGLELRYEVDDYTDPWRNADTLLLVHAAMGSSRRFRAWVPHLARDFRVVRLDQRGHGESGRRPACLQPGAPERSCCTNPARSRIQG